jgi:hypothetical protein
MSPLPTLELRSNRICMWYLYLYAIQMIQFANGMSPPLDTNLGQLSLHAGQVIVFQVDVKTILRVLCYSASHSYCLCGFL